MATYVNDLRLKEISTGDEAGTWGTSTNTNLELIAEAFSFGTEAITTNADTHTTTIADGSTDPGRSLFLKYTGTLDSTCTITIGPNTVSKLWFIENATSGSQSIIIKQGSGATVTIANGQTKAIYSDGAGSGGAMVDALQDLSVPDLFIDDDLTFTSDSAVITFGADGDTTLTHTDGSGLTLNSTNKIMFNDASQFIQGSSATVLALGATDEIDLTATLIDINGNADVSGTVTATGTSVFASLDISGDIDVDGTTNLDVVDIDGAVDMASTLQVDGAITSSAGATITVADNTDNLSLISTDTDDNSGPNLRMYRFSANPADADVIGQIDFEGRNDNTQDVRYGFISAKITDASDGTEDGQLRFFTIAGGTETETMTLNSGNVGIGTTSPQAAKFSGSAVGILELANTKPVINIHETDVTDAEFFMGMSGGSAVIGTSGNGLMIFQTGTSSTSERMRIDSSGNVGIGNSNPAAFNSLSGKHVVIGSGAEANTLTLFSDDTNDANGFGHVAFADSNASGSTAQYAGLIQYKHSDNTMRFYTNASESMHIDSSQRLLINTTSILSSSSAKLQVLQTVSAHWTQRINNSTGSPYGLAIDYTSVNPNGTDNHFIYCTSTTGAKFGVYSNGGVLNYSGNNVNLSDRNAKKDITIHTDNEWNCVKAWEIVDYRYKDEADDSPVKIGVIAQQIQEHCPDLVNVFQEQADAVEEVLGEDGEVVTEAKAAVEERIGVNEAQMMWKVTKALQEAMTRIETLEAKVQTLENN